MPYSSSLILKKPRCLRGLKIVCAYCSRVVSDKTGFFGWFRMVSDGNFVLFVLQCPKVSHFSF
nr:MAG TPA: hypothetical protein [Caudoviricetes sp.]